MKKGILLFTIAYLFLPSLIHACSCLEVDYFCDRIANYKEYPNSGAIVRAKVESKSDTEVTLKIRQLLFGEVWQEEVVVKSDLCTYYFSDLKRNKEYIFALHHYEGFFSPPGCGVWFLEMDGNKVRGDIKEGKKSLRYTDFTGLEECGDVLDYYSLERKVSIFPNPASYIVNIENNRETFIEKPQLIIYDAIGNAIASYAMTKDLLTGEIWPIDIQDFPVGLYFFKLRGTFDEAVFKVIKQRE